MFPSTDGGSIEMSANKRQLGRLPRIGRIPRLPMAFGDVVRLRTPVRTGRKRARKGGVAMLLAMALLRLCAARGQSSKPRGQQE